MRKCVHIYPLRQLMRFVLGLKDLHCTHQVKCSGVTERRLCGAIKVFVQQTGWTNPQVSQTHLEDKTRDAPIYLIISWYKFWYFNLALNYFQCSPFPTFKISMHGTYWNCFYVKSHGDRDCFGTKNWVGRATRLNEFNLKAEILKINY